MSGRIVLVEDSDEVRRFAKMLLTRKDFDVTDYPDGQAAYEAIIQNPPDLIVSDVQMPRMDGLELTSRLRERFNKGELPIVLVSVMSEEEDIVRGFEAGANDYLVKPYRTTELLAKVSVLLREGPFLRQNDEPELPQDDTSMVKLGDEDTRAVPVDKGQGSVGSVRYFFDKYEIVGEFGRGGMGTVYRAIKRDDGRQVALKVLAPRLSENRTSIARFLREIKLLSDITSPQVVRVFDHGYDGGRYFLAMEAVEGQSLDRKVVHSGPLEEELSASIFMQVAEALAALSDHDLVHRDVKPANILVCDNGVVKLVDFGLAKHQHDDLNLSESGYALGTPYYIAPEIIEGGQASPQSDLFALGVSFFEVLTGRRPFPGVVPYQIFRLIVSGNQPNPLDHRPELSEDLVAIVNRLLERDCQDRYMSASDVASDLRAWLEKRGKA
ncbi:MAG: protein kinase [Planctomycetota bacterium]|nr:protein kinase [Planctomycetota bacterium]